MLNQYTYTREISNYHQNFMDKLCGINVIKSDIVNSNFVVTVIKITIQTV